MNKDTSTTDGVFLARCTKWRWATNDTIELLNAENTPVGLLSAWETLVFHDADGSNTAEDIVNELMRTHPGKGYDYYMSEVSKAVDGLLKLPFAIQCRSFKENVDSAFDLPIDEQEPT